MGRTVWVLVKMDAISPYWDGPHKILSFKQFLPSGLLDDDRERKQSLVQVFCEQGGMRTWAVANVVFRDPGRTG